MSTRAPERRWQITPRRLHRFIGRHVQHERNVGPDYQGMQNVEVTCSCGCEWSIVR